MNRQAFAICALTLLFLRFTRATLPPIACDSSETISPIRVEWVGDYCFKTTYQPGLAGCTGNCCDTDVFRVDFGIRRECANNIEDISVVPVNPSDMDDSFVLMNWDDRGMLSLANIWEGYTYCFTMTFPAGDTACDIPRFADACNTGPRGNCEYRIVNTLATCCPTFELLPTGTTSFPDTPVTPNAPVLSPPPPPPQPNHDFTGFPYCNCMNRESHYMMQYEGLNLLGEECFMIWTKYTCTNPSSPCCTFDINKIELAIPNDCLSSVAHARVNGTVRSVSQAWNLGRNNDKAVFRVTNLDNQLEVMNVPGQGVEICLKMRDNARCPSVHQMCGGTDQCTYAIFERVKSPGYCCVVGNAPTSFV